jgi:hypothetical protein
MLLAKYQCFKPPHLPSISELVAASAHDELLTIYIGKVRLMGIDFDEDFFSELVERHFRRKQLQAKSIFCRCVWQTYMRENPSAHRRKFKTVTQQS